MTRKGLTLGMVLLLALGMSGLRSDAPVAPVVPLGTITGRVTLDSGQPAAGFVVSAVPASMPRLRLARDNPNSTKTDADGRYTLVLQPSQFGFYSGPANLTAKGFLVFVRNGDQPYIEPPPVTTDPQRSPDGKVGGIDFVLRLGPQITVFARDAVTGTPDAGVKVQFGREFGVDRTAGVTGTDGRLRFRVPFTKIRLQADLPDTMEAAPGYGTGSVLHSEMTLDPGQETVWDLKTYAANSRADTDWHGHVQEPDGRPAAGVAVTFLRQYNETVNLVTDAQGRFSVRMPRLEYGEAAGWTPHIMPLVYARRGPMTAAQTVTPDESWDGLTLRLTSGATLIGRLTAPSRQPASAVAVSLSWQVPGRDGPPVSLPAANTDAQGRFAFLGLPPGIYSAQASGSGYGDLALPSPAPGSPVSTPSFKLAVGDRRDLGTASVPHADRTLLGTVVDRQGLPVHGLSVFVGVRVTGAHVQHATAAVQRDGTFRVSGLVDEPLHVALSGTGDLPAVDVLPGQNSVRLVVSPEAAAANAPIPPPLPPAPHARVSQGPLTAIHEETSLYLNGLGLRIHPDEKGFAVSVLRLQANTPHFGIRFMGFRGSDATTLWQGTLDETDGMRLTVLEGHGTLTDRTGRILWEGPMQDPPDYTLATTRQSGRRTTTLRDSAGNTLWSGTDEQSYVRSGVSNGFLRLYGQDHTMVWKRVVGSARVAVRSDAGDDVPFAAHYNSFAAPVDGVITVHLLSATGTLRTEDDRVAWTGPVRVVTTSVVGSLTQQDWPITAPLLSFQNPPPHSTLTFTDAAGVPLRVKQTFR